MRSYASARSGIESSMHCTDSWYIHYSNGWSCRHMQSARRLEGSSARACFRRATGENSKLHTRSARGIAKSPISPLPPSRLRCWHHVWNSSSSSSCCCYSLVLMSLLLLMMMLIVIKAGRLACWLLAISRAAASVLTAGRCLRSAGGRSSCACPARRAPPRSSLCSP